MMNKNLKTTLKACPAITLATIGLCYLTQTAAAWLGVSLPDQANLELVRRCAGLNWTFALLCLQVLLLMPAIEEFVFRWLLWKLPGRSGFLRTALCVVSSVLFSAAHYIAQPFPDSAFLALFFFGLAQCWLYAKTGRIWCPMVNHALFNMVNLVLLFVFPEAQ